MRVFLTAVLLLTIAGCEGRVQVFDPAGKPVAGAQVAPVSLSMNGAATPTDDRGEASVSLRVGGQDTKWVAVSKQGFEPQQVPVPAKWPLKVILQPTNR
jgi:hypothetical protein